MSISPPASTVTTLPSAPVPAPIVPPVAPTPAAPRGPEIAVFWVCIAWAIAGLVVAYILRAFRRKSIVGPVRVASTQSAANLLIILIGTYILIPAVGITLARKSNAPEDVKSVVVNIVLYVAMSGTIIAALAASGIENLKLLGFDPRKIGRGIAGGGATLFVIYPLVQLTGKGVEILWHLKEPEAHPLLLFLKNDPGIWWKVLAIMSAVVVAPVTEEILFRGLLQSILGRFFAYVTQVYSIGGLSENSPATGPEIPAEYTPVEPVNPGPGARWAAVLVTAALFAAVHNSLIFFLPLFVLAIALGYVYERTGNIWVNITTHALFNAGQILFFLALLK